MSKDRAVWRTYHDVRAAVELLQAAVCATLNGELAGLYLCGSLASGDFDPRTSDIDFLAVTQGEPSPAKLAELAAMHRRLAEGGNAWLAELEGSYIPVAAVRRHVPGRPHPRIERGSGELAMAAHDSDWVLHRHIAREQGVVLAGPRAAELIDPVTPSQLRQAVRELLAEWWEPMERATTEKLLPLGYRYYAVQTMCRMLYTLETGAIASKPTAAEWALERLDSRWRPLIRESLAWPRAERRESHSETLALIKYVGAVARKFP